MTDTKQTAASIASVAILKMIVTTALVASAFLAMAGTETDAALLDVDAGKPIAAGSPAALIAEHDCWTGDGPEGVTPGHVVMRYDGESMARYLGPKHVAVALDSIFDAPDASVAQVVGFCR